MQENRANRDWIISDLLTVIDTEDLHFCLEYRTVEVCGQEIELTAKEFDLLELLAMNQDKVYSRENLLNIVWGYEYPGDARTVDVHIRIMPIPGKRLSIISAISAGN